MNALPLARIRSGFARSGRLESGSNPTGSWISARARIAFAVLLLGLGFVPAASAENFNTLIDIDNSDATGCTVGTFQGADFELVTPVDTSVDPPMVASSPALLNQCVAGSFVPFVPFTGCPTPFPLQDPAPTGWPAPSEATLDAVETYVSLCVGSAPGSPQPGPSIQLGFFSGPRSAPIDTLFTDDGTPTGDPVVISLGPSVAEIPTLGEWSLLALALLLFLVGCATLRRRRSRAGLFVGLLLLTSGLGIALAASPHAADGILSDWATGHSPLANDPADPSLINSDIQRAWATIEDSILFLRIDINAGNQAPIATAQSVTTDEDTPVVITLTGSDPESDPLTFAVGTGPSNGTLSAITPIDATSAQATYTPGADFNGADSFTFTVNDGTATSLSATASITVNAVNDTPVANAQSVATNENTPLVITLTGSDIDNNPLTFAVGTGPSNGTLSAITPIDATSAQVTYTPGAAFNGADSFTFTVNDGTATSPTAAVSITVGPVPDAPVANAQSVTTDEDVPLVITLTGSDADSDPLTFAIGTGPSNGTLSAITPINATSAQVTYTPGADFNGADSFTFTVNDGTTTSLPATVSATVNAVPDAPVANAQSVTTDEDTPLVITLTGSDADNDSLTFAIGTGPSNGTLSAITPINATSAQVTYTPGASFNGADSFDFTVNDGTTTSPAATVSITVSAVNDVPVANAQSVTTNEDTPLVITLTGSDTENSSLTFAVGTGPSNGSLSAITPINATSAQVTYTPGTNFNGADSFTFTANDGTATSLAAAVSITVTADNDTPVANTQSVATNEDTPLVITLTGSDIDGDSLTFATGPASNGTLSAITPINATSAQVTYTPGTNFNGADSFTFTVNDGTVTSPAAAVSITVSGVNDAPVANAQSVATNEDTPLVITLTGSDIDGDSLTFATGPASNGTLSAITPINATSAQVTYTPGTNFNGADSFTFTANDGTATSPAAAVSLTVNAVNDTPVANAQSVATNEDTPLVITLTGSDIDGDSLTFATGPASNGTLSAITPINATSAQVTYTPGTNFNGADSFTFTANDGTATSPAAAVAITVNAVNDTPVANAQSVATNEDTPLVITLTGSDIDGDSLTFATGPASNGTLSAITPISPTSAQVTYTPNLNYNGAGSFTFTVNDGTATSPAAAVAITVNAVNDTPVANAQSVATNEDTPLVITLTGSDIDGDSLTFATGPASNGTLSAITPISPTSAQVTYTPNLNYNGAGSFTFTVNDGTATSPAAAVAITVNAVNDTPVANAQSVATNEDTPLVITLTGSDIDGDSLTFATGPASNGTLSAITPISPTSAQVTYTPNLNYNGTGSFTFTVNDGTATSPAAAVSITVNAVNDPPVANPDAANITEEAPNVAAANTVSGSVLANDTDPDSSLTVSAIAGGSVGSPRAGTYGSVTINSNGSFTYTLDDSNPTVNALAPGQMLTDPFGYTASDGALTSSSTLTVTINGADDPATPDNDAFDFIGNTELEVDRDTASTPEVLATTPPIPAALGVLDGDIDPDGGPAISISGIAGCGDLTAPFDCVLAGQGTVSLQANGSFSFVPEPGDTDLTASFQYTLTGNPNQATVTLTRFERVWFVDPNAGGGGNGTSALPFNSLDALDGGADSDVAGDYIFVHDGTLALSGPMPMENNQHLIGEGHVAVTTPADFALSIPVSLNGNSSPTNLVPTGTRPQLTNASGDTVRVTTEIPIEIVGLSLAGGTIAGGGSCGSPTFACNAIDVTSAAALTGSSTLTIGNNEFRGAGAEGIDVNLNAATTGTLTLNVTDNSWNTAGTHTGNAVDVNRAAGTLRLNVSNNTSIVSAAAAGSAVNINGGAAASTTITGFANNTVHQNTAGSGIFITNVTLDSDLGTANLQFVSGGSTSIGVSGDGVGGGGLLMSAVTGEIRFTDLDVVTSGGAGVSVVGTGPFTGAAGTRLEVGNVSTVDATGGPAVDITSATIDLQPGTLKSTTTSSGVSLSNTAGMFSVPSGPGNSITKSSGGGAAFSVDNSAAGTTVLTSTYGGTINNSSSTGRSVSINNADSGSSASFAGQVTDNPGQGVTLTANTGASISFSGGLTLSTSTSTGFNATGGGTIAVTDPVGAANNTITTTTGTALNVNATTIGASGLIFERISAGTSGSPASGIVLNNTGSGALTVTGTGSAGTGGTINSATGAGISLTNTGTINLSHMNVQNGGDDGIRGATVNGLNLTGLSITSNGNAVGERGIEMTELTGTGSMSNCTVTGSAEDNVYIVNDGAGNLTSFNVTGSTFATTAQAAPGNDGFLIQNTGSGDMAVSITGSTFTDNRGDHFQASFDATATSAASMDVTFSNNTLNTTAANDPNVLGGGITLSPSGGGDMTFMVSGNNIQQAFAAAINLNLGTGATASASMNGTVTNNTVGTAGSADSGSESSDGIDVIGNAAGSTAVTITNNQVRQFSNDSGIKLLLRDGTGSMNATVTGNTVKNPGTFAVNGIHASAGATAGDTGTMCVHISGNDVSGSSANGGTEIRARQRFGTTVRLPGYGGANNDTAAVNAFISGQNSGATTSSVVNVPGGGGFIGGAACPTP